MKKKPRFVEPGCIGCDAHLDFGLNRYCAGFQNKKRRKPFRKSDPLYKAPKWCPKRKDPCEYRIYRYADEQSAVLARLMQDAKREKDFVFPLAHHYQLCAEGHTGLSPQAFFEQANDMGSDCLLGEEELHTGDVVEIDTGLAQFFFYCAGLYDFRPAFFDARRIQTQTGKQDAADPEVL